MFRYSLKNKGSFFGLFFLVYIAIATFSCFGTLNTSLLNTYDTLTEEYNMHNVVINELYDPNNYDVNQARFRTWLRSQNEFSYRNFEAFDVSTNKDSYKMINYSNEYSIDMLDMFQNQNETKWILDSVFHPYSLNDFVYQAQINQSILKNIIYNQSMEEFVKSDYINKNTDWYKVNGSTNLPAGSKIWFGMYQNIDDDLVIDAYVINSNNEVVGYRPNILTLNKKDFKSFKKLTLNDYNNNFSWKYAPNSFYPTEEQKYLDQLSINLFNNTTLPDALFPNSTPRNGSFSLDSKLTNSSLNSIALNTEKEVYEYLKNPVNKDVKEINISDLKLSNLNPTSYDVLNLLLQNTNVVTNIKVLPSKEHFNEKALVSNEIDFFFTIKNNAKITTYILKNVPKYKPLLARQYLFAFAANSNWSSKSANKIKKQYKSIESFVKFNPIFDYAWFLNDSFNSQLSGTPLETGLKQYNVVYNKDSYLMKGINNWVNNKGPNASGINLLINDFKIVFDLSSGGEVVSGIFTDPTSYGAVVSPTWLEKNNKAVLPKQEWINFLNKSTSDISLESVIKEIDQKYIINVSSTPYIILSTGITPDFMYPIISFENMVPNPENQAIVYVGTTGYSRCFEAFQNNPREQILLGKYIGSSSLQSYVNNLNNDINKNNFMSWPQGTNAVYTYDSKENKITPATLRVTFTSSLIKTVNVFSIAISVFISLIALFVITILIRQFVVKNRQTLGIMNANGYSKSKVIYALSTLGLIPAVLGGLLGYLIGFFTNGFALSLFDTYWLLPVNTVSFSITFLVLAVLIPLILFIAITLLIGAISLRGSATTLLSKTQTIKVGIVARVVNKSISKTPIMIRFRSSVMFSTFYRLLVLSFMTSLVIVSTEFMSSSLDSFSKTEQISVRESNYKFSVDLFTPTNEGGEFYGMSYKDLGKAFLKPEGEQNIANSVYSDIYKKNPYVREYPNVHLPSVNDATSQTKLLDYLKYKTQVRELINFNMLTSNPWEFAQNMMPSNQANQAINSTKNINEKLMNDTRLLSLKTFLNVTTDNKLSSNFPKEFDATTLGKLIGNNHIYSPGLSLVDNKNDIKPIHIINFNGSKDVNYNNSEDLVIDVNDLIENNPQQFNDNIDDFMLIKPEIIFNSINGFYTSNIINNQIFKLNGIFNQGIEKHAKISISSSNPNVIDITFDKNINVDSLLQTKNVLTNRSLFTGYFYEPHQKADKEFNNSAESWQQALKQNINNWYLDPFSVIKNKDNPVYYSAVNNTMVADIPIKLKPSFISFILNYFNDENYAKKIFRITYGLIGLDQSGDEFKDEPYVYVNGVINSLNNKNVVKPLTNYIANNDIQLVGIVGNSKYIDLIDDKDDKINYLIENWDINSKDIPVVINEFAAKKYNLKIGDSFKIEPKNTIDRFGNQLNSNYVSNIVKNASNYNIKIVGISQSFHNAYAYIPIDAARKLIGLSIPSLVPNNSLSTSITSFNGLFSHSENPYSLTNTVGLYSPSGLYPGTSSWEPVSDIVTKLITNAVTANSSDNNYIILNKALGSDYYQGEAKDRIAYMKKSSGITDNIIPNSFVQEIAKKLAETYGATTYQSMVMNVMAIDNSQALYSSLSETVISLEATVLTLIFIISLIVMMIMLWMILMDLMPLLALLATMGMSVWSNSLTFMCILIPTWFISAIISGPIVWALLNVFKEFVFKSIGILLLAPFNWWAYILILLVIGGIFGIVYVLGAKKLSNTNVADAIKR